MIWPALPVFARVAGRPVILIGSGESADAKRRLLERAGAVVAGEAADARLAVVALPDPEEAVARLRARGILVNAVDRPDLCDFTLPAIVDRAPVLVAIGTGGVSAGLAAAIRQRLESVLPASLGALAEALHAARGALRARFPDTGDRRRAIGRALAEEASVETLLASAAPSARTERLTVPADPDDLTLRQARLLAQADRIVHRADVPAAILDRARADAVRIMADDLPAPPEPGLTLFVERAQ